MVRCKTLSYRFKITNPSRRGAIRWVSYTLLLCLFISLTYDVGETQGDSSPPEMIKAGSSYTAALSGGETKSYSLPVEAGQHILLEIDKGDVALKVSACTQAGNSCLEFLRRSYGKFDVSFTASDSGEYKLLIKSIDSVEAKRSVQLRLVHSIAAATQHKFVNAATAAAAEAEDLRTRPDLFPRLAAATKYVEAGKFWESAGEKGKAAAALCDAADVYFSLSKYREALKQFEDSITDNKENDKLTSLVALSGIAYMKANLGENDQAFEEAQTILKQLAEIPKDQLSPSYKRIEAQVTNTIGEVHHARREYPKAIEVFLKTIPIWREANDLRGEALAELNLGYANGDLGDLRRASQYYQRALSLFSKTGDERGMSLAQTANAGALSVLGEPQNALDLHKQALQYFRQTGNKQGEATALNGIAGAYEDLTEYQAAIDHYSMALPLFEEVGNLRFVALTKFVIGRALYRLDKPEDAEKYCLASLDLSRKIQDQVVEANVLQSLATIYFARGDTPRAFTQIEAALKLYQSLKNWWSEAYALNDIGHFQTAIGKLEAALDTLKQARKLMESAGDLRGQALTLVNLARVEWQRSNFTIAISLVEDSLKITESLHGRIRNNFLRTSFFTSVQQQYEVYVEMLMKLHHQSPEKGYDKQALVANERSRARTLVDSLFKYRPPANDQSSADLVSREMELLQALNDKAARQTRLLERGQSKETEELSQEIRSLTIEFQDVRSKLRERDSGHAILTQTAELQVEDLQRVVDDNDTLLLVFSLGERQSYLWLVSHEWIESYELPARDQLDEQVRKVAELVTARQAVSEKRTQLDPEKLKEADAEYWRQAQLLSNTLLGKAESRLGTKRLLVVSDGLLQHVSFDALPIPNSATAAGSIEPKPLFIDHEVISIPSALTLAALRKPRDQRDSTRKAIAIVADPVFEPDDPRIAQAQHGAPKPEREAYLSMALRSVNDNSERVTRLPSTLREANAIMNVTPAGEGTVTTGFLANRDQVMNGALQDFRIIHFATHGLLNGEHPELSGIILSLLDEHGNSRNGFLRINDVYSLHLPADLIVLSACRTGLGKTVRGEGVVGLPSAFMYAGAKSVVASLWKVDDEATAELMRHFYTGIFQEGLRPSAALRKARIEMWKQERWRAPFYWGAFVYQGDYADHVNAQSRTPLSTILTIGGVLALLAATSLVAIRLKRKHA